MKKNLKAAGITALILAGVCALSWIVIAGVCALSWIVNTHPEGFIVVLLISLIIMLIVWTFFQVRNNIN